MAIKIFTDSGTDYEQYEIKEKNIDVLPIPIEIDGHEYLSGLNLSKNEFFQMLENGCSFPKTAQPSPQVYIDYFEEAKKNGDDVIAIIISGSLSGMVQTVFMCRDTVGYENVYVIDSVNATAGQRLLVDNAVRLRDEGKTAKEIYEATEALKKRIRLYATFPTLKYLVKGGRLSHFEATAAAIARIKPVISINGDGEVYVCHKGVGIKHSIEYMAQMVAEEQIDENYPVFPIYSGDPVNCKIMLEKIANKGIVIGEDKMRNIGPTIGTYVGVGATGIVYVKK
ncbi:MAG: DegV family protein [Clostridia bacterium]|nr:DegV family protein [Clostridia bacterium]